MPTMENLQQIGVEALTGLIQNFKSGVRNPVSFLLANPIPANETLISVNIRNGHINTGTFTGHNSKAVERDPTSTTKRGFEMLHTFFSMEFADEFLDSLKDLSTNMNKDRGRSYLESEARFATGEIDNNRIAASLKALHDLELGVNASGKLMHSTSGAAYTIDYGVDTTTHIGSVNGANVGDWSDPATDIVQSIDNVVDFLIQESNMAPTTVVHGRNIPRYVANNTSVQTLIAGSDSLSQAAFNNNAVPASFRDLNWINAGSVYWIDETGTRREIVDPDACIFMPNPIDFWKFYEGPSRIPTNAIGQVYSDAVSARGGIERVIGKFAYAVNEHNPVRTTMFWGDTFLPVIENPLAIARLDTDTTS